MSDAVFNRFERCEWCGGAIEQPATGRRRRTCGDAHRQALSRAERRTSPVTKRDVLAVTQRPGPWLLDLFCKAGGAAAGYARAGWKVIGVDHYPQPRYPYLFVQDDALAFLDGGGAEGFQAIHASPPCQAFSIMTRNLGFAHLHPDLVDPIRDKLRLTGLPYVIENVPGAPLQDPVMVCGSSLGMNLRRHRLFESNIPLMVPPCAHGWQTPRFAPASNRKNLARVVNIYGAGSDVELWRETFETPWMTRDEIAEAIPPRYTELIGSQLLAAVTKLAGRIDHPSTGLMQVS